ncbi:hypothetical protein HDU67_002726 [Dinochytrium kinnereticum]|nr:hypothetical protein HDU67_002726 [Dinochytrium kinnereticum]
MPAPWVLTVGKSFVLPFNVGKHNAEEISKFHVNEHDKADFLGTGLSSVMIVRYTESPAGPYDELLLMNGACKSRGKSRTGQDPRSGKYLSDRRIPLIWVSSEASLRQGRINWGIRKELADFTWVETDKGTRVTIRERYDRPGSSAGSILLDITVSCPLGPFVQIPATTWGPINSVLFPLLERRIDDEGEEVEEGGWFMTRLAWNGWARPATVAEIHKTGPGFPDAKALGFYPVGGMLTGLLTFLEPVILDDE